AIPIPSGGQGFGAHENITLVAGMAGRCGQFRRPQTRTLARGGPDGLAMRAPLSRPRGHALQLNAANGGLHFRHAAVAAELFVQPAKAGWVLAFVDGLPAFAMILQAPDTRPQRVII